MKINETQLRKIIQESVKNVLNEEINPRLRIPYKRLSPLIFVIKSTKIPGPPASQMACALSGDLFTISHIQKAAFFFTISSGSLRQFNNFCGLLILLIT